MKILICASEVVPFAKTGGLADVAGALPKALTHLGHEARVALPKYGRIDEKEYGLTRVASLSVPLAGRQEEVEIWQSAPVDGVTALLVGHESLFASANLYGSPNDAVRFAFFCRALLEYLKSDRAWRPEVVHCNDWQTGLIPLYLKSLYRTELGKIASVFTVHNLAYQGLFDRQALFDAGLDWSYFTMSGIEFYGQVSFMKAGLVYADLLNTVSETYAREIQTPEFGERLEGVLHERRNDLFGIVNGIDYEIWNPGTDKHLAKPYKANTSELKQESKLALQRRLGLSESKAPLLGLVSRLATQKGFDLLAEVLPQLLALDVQFVLLGSGEKVYHDLFSDLARKYPRKLSASFGFHDDLAHQIYGGADMFLMPSRYEPCGLGQLISMRYGTIPVVRATGGLADTVEDYDPERGAGNGFVFREYSAVALFGAIARGLCAYQDQAAWNQLRQRVMARDFSWEASARKYLELYQKALAKKR